MKIGIIGSGDVGRALGRGLAAAGHQVKLGTRDPSQDKIKAWLAEAGAPVSVGIFAEAAAFGELVVFSVGWAHAEAIIRLADPGNFSGKVVLDTTNPLRFEAEGKPPVLTVGHTDSAGEQVQRWLPKARVVKAFNIVGNVHMVNPAFPDGKPDMFICGNDADAKRAVGGLIEQLGWPPAIDLGTIDKARYLEPMAMVWITHLFNNGFNPNHAFKLLRK
jgi:predicted dinucleotide-binding enzyme